MSNSTILLVTCFACSASTKIEVDEEKHNELMNDPLTEENLPEHVQHMAPYKGEEEAQHFVLGLCPACRELASVLSMVGMDPSFMVPSQEVLDEMIKEGQERVTHK